MQTPSNLNDQHAWGGDRFSPSGTNQQDVRPPSLPQDRVIASSSDNLFHPVSREPSSYVFALPTVPAPLNPCFCSSHHSPFSRPLPYPSSFTSYNNPNFAIPPPVPRPLHDQSHFIPNSVPLGPPPPVPPRIHPLPVYNDPQPQFIQPQHAYIHPFPPPNQSLPTYSQPLHPNQVLYAHHTVPPVPSPSPSSVSSSLVPTVASLPKTLPMVTHIPVLTSKHDFYPWDEGVHALIRANGLIGHILDPSTYVDPSRPDLAPNPPPVLSMSSSPREIEALNRWWAEDNIVQHILVSCLSSSPRGLLPSSSSLSRTALSMYQTLTQYYGTCNYADCAELMFSLNNSVCTTGRIPDFVTKWRVGLAKLQSAKFFFDVKLCITAFV